MKDFKYLLAKFLKLPMLILMKLGPSETCRIVKKLLRCGIGKEILILYSFAKIL